jgi:hypothetical protein
MGAGIPNVLISLFSDALSTDKLHNIKYKGYYMNGQFEGLWKDAVMTSLA